MWRCFFTIALTSLSKCFCVYTVCPCVCKIEVTATKTELFDVFSEEFNKLMIFTVLLNDFPLYSWVFSTGCLCTMLAGILTCILPHQCCSHGSKLFIRCVPSLHLDTPRKLLHSRADILLRRQFPTHFHSQFRGVKTRNSKFKGQEEEWKTRNKTILTYIAAAGVGMIGLSYAAVPLYRLYCQVCCKIQIKFDYCVTQMSCHAFLQRKQSAH